MGDPSNAGDRAKAYRLRKSKQLTEIDRLWLADYEERAERRKQQGSKNFGASKAKRTVKFEMDEQQEAIGTGTAAAAAASAALVAKEEGRRLDALTINALDGYKQLVADQRAFMLEMRRNERNAQARVALYESTHLGLLKAWEANFIARTETEAELARAEQQEHGDPAKEMLLYMIARKMGIPVGPPPALNGLPQPPRPPRPPANGAKPKK